MTCVLQTKTWCKKTLVTIDKGFEYSRLEDLLGSSWKNANSSTSFALLAIAPNVVLRELLRPAKKLEKTVRALIEASVLR